MLKSYWFALLILISAALPQPSRAATWNDLEFARPAGEALLLDIQVPEGSGPFATLIFVHGGDFIGGSRKGGPKLLVDDVKRAGYAWATIDYRLAPKHRYPAQIEDIEAAVRFLRRNGPKFSIDPERLVLVGESAGVLLVSYAGTRFKDDSRVAGVISLAGTHDLYRRFHPTGGCFVAGKFVPNPQPGKPQFCMPAGISAYLGIDGPGADALKRIRAASPIEHLRKEMPPYLLLHGTADRNAPFEQSVYMYEAMRAAGARCELYVVDGGGHSATTWEAVTDQGAYRKYVLEWLGKLPKN